MADYTRRRIMMVDTQVRPSDVTEFPIIDAMLDVPRELFVPQALREAAYSGEHLPLDSRRVILDPRTLAKLCDALDVTPEDLVLDIGPGMGYSSAILARLSQAVVAVEPVPAYVTEAQAALAEAGIDNAAINEGALNEGAPEYAPFDVIVIQGGIEVLPDTIVDQLAENGRICCIFMERELGTARIGRKVDGRIHWRYAFNASAPVLPGYERTREFTL
ncbi:protein-L-isoaspartate O-methyltransferase [Palleronia sp. LCG004]|uniref:protein-L-isoaspartate O-methyltransferase family protein n=1 Tax=Palleronia sp. LCG004 TaxID=3079304 RepID=UPI00294272AE|nr:protein-L-isoaspartate O-methyltransferase [Palleronia sp. LCG004]WOI55157.1 protein-L-isoaspartate O-methyltransferase [Palleronia sp. LCG004]